MPWLAIPFNDQPRLQNLISIFKPRYIPTLVIMDKEGKIISKNGKNNISTMGIKAYDHWVKLRDDNQIEDYSE
jgi:hypothetical protein